MPTYKNRDGADVPATQLSNEDLLNLPATDRNKALVELARQGTQLAVLVVDVGAPCPGPCEGSGRVTLDDGTKIDCHTCDGTGTVDGRSKCLVEGCFDFGQPLSPTLTGWECARVHAHGALPLPLDVEPPSLADAGDTRRFWPITPAMLADIGARQDAARERLLPKPQMDADAFPWDEPAPPTRGTVADVARAVNKIGLDAVKVFRALESVADVEARFVTPADLAAVVAIDIPESVAAVYREAGEKMDAEIAKLILGPTSIPPPARRYEIHLDADPPERAPTSTVEDIMAEMAWHKELGDE